MDCEQFYVMFRTPPRNSEESIEHKLRRRIIDRTQENTRTMGAFLRHTEGGIARSSRRHASFFPLPSQLLFPT